MKEQEKKGNIFFLFFGFSFVG